MAGPNRAPRDGHLSPLRAIVTGAARGLGRAIALRLLRDSAYVAVCDVDRDALRSFAGAAPGVQVFALDVAEPESVGEMVRAVQDQAGGVDVLINNAAITGPYGPVEENDPVHWARTVDVNLVGYFHCIHHVVPLMKQAGSGSIINISSVAGRLGYPLRTAYASSKWAIIGLTQSLAMELGPSGIRVNAVLPGIVDNERHRMQVQAQAERRGIEIEEMNARYLETISMRRKVTEEDVADLVAFLASPQARNISGQSLGVCGNVETMRRR